jgi:hypothetical protein
MEFLLVVAGIVGIGVLLATLNGEDWHISTIAA